MRDDWLVRPLSDAAARVTAKTRVEPGRTYRALGVYRDGAGLFEKEAFVGGETTYKTLTEVRTGHLVLRSITAWEAPISVASSVHDGLFVSSVFPVFELDNELLLPDFMALVCQWPHFWSEMRERSTGTVLRRKTLSAEALLSIPVPMPPLVEQRRIVDLISSIDHAIQFGVQYADGLTDARRQLLSQLLEPKDDWPATTLSDAADIQMGQSPPGSTYNEVGDGLPFLQGSAEFGFRHPTPVKWCSAPKKKAQVGDLLVSVRAPVGDLNFADRELAIGRGLAVMRGRSGTSTTGFLALAIERNLQELEMRAGGGMFKSITKQGLRGLPIFLPSLLEQQPIVELVSSVDENLEHLRRHIAACETLRSQILEDLLFGTHEIPDSYDRFLEVAS